jgi:glycosyltransferase involved in cell wall biosynthesis
VGTKRNELVEQAQGKYACFIDDDDEIDPEYFVHIGNALEAVPDADCTSLIGKYYVDGEFQKHFYHSVKFKDHMQDNETYYRPPNHLNPILTGYIKQIRFPEKSFGEDLDFTMRLSKSMLIAKEVQLTKPLYSYYFNSKK